MQKVSLYPKCRSVKIYTKKKYVVLTSLLFHALNCGINLTLGWYSLRFTELGPSPSICSRFITENRVFISSILENSLVKFSAKSAVSDVFTPTTAATFSTSARDQSPCKSALASVQLALVVSLYRTCVTISMFTKGFLIIDHRVNHSIKRMVTRNKE